MNPTQKLIEAAADLVHVIDIYKPCPLRVEEAAEDVRTALEGLREAEPVAFDDCRISLVTALHMLASDFENALYKFDGDDEARRAANGSIAHARKVAARWNWSGATPPTTDAPAQGVASDTERLAFVYSGQRTESNALVELEVRCLNEDYPTLDEVRAAIDDAMKAAAPTQEGATK